MKALSIRQPWAWLIIYGGKDIENRTWRTHFEGRFLVHASKTFDEHGYKNLQMRGMKMPERDEFLRGGIIGSVELVSCVQREEKLDSSWHIEGCYGFVLKDPQPLPFLPMRGKLAFFDVNDDLLSSYKHMNI